MSHSRQKGYGGDILTYREPIFDRAETDILKLKYFLSRGYKNLTENEKNEWLNTNFKGALNISDLNRIEQNMNVLSEILGLTITVKPWQETDIPINTDFTRIRNNLISIRSQAVLQGLIYNSTPEVPNLPFNTYQKINDIEKIIFDIYMLYTIKYYYCGQELYCGETIGIN